MVGKTDRAEMEAVKKGYSTDAECEALSHRRTWLYRNRKSL